MEDGRTDELVVCPSDFLWRHLPAPPRGGAFAVRTHAVREDYRSTAGGVGS